MKKLPKSAIILVIVLLLLFVSVNLNSWIGQPILNSEQLQATQFAISLIGIFLGAHYELRNLERQLLEERRKEIRQQRLNILDYIDTWLNDVNSNLEDIAVLIKLSPKDEKDGAVILSQEVTKPIQENLVRLDKRGNLAVAKAVDIGDQDLAGKAGVVWLLLYALAENLSKGFLPGVDAVVSVVTEARRAVDKARMSS